MSRPRRQAWFATHRRRLPPFGLLVGLLVVAVFLPSCDSTPVLVWGTVHTEVGSLKGKVQVQLYANDSETLVATTTTNGIGHYQFHESAASDGTYRMRFGDQWWPNESSWATATPLQLTGASTTTVDVVLDGAAWLQGSGVRPDGSPAVGVAFYAVDGTGEVTASTLTGPDGTYSLGLPEAGGHTVHVADLDAGASVAVGGDNAITFTPADGELVDVGAIDITTGLPPSTEPTTTTTLPPDCEQQYAWEPPLADPPITDPGGPLPQFDLPRISGRYFATTYLASVIGWGQGTDPTTFTSVETQTLGVEFVSASIEFTGEQWVGFIQGSNFDQCSKVRFRAVNASGTSPWVIFVPPRP